MQNSIHEIQILQLVEPLYHSACHIITLDKNPTWQQSSKTVKGASPEIRVYLSVSQVGFLTNSLSLRIVIDLTVP